MKNNFNIIFNKTNLPHASILISEDEAALCEASLYLSKIVMCDGSGDDDCIICKKIMHKNHADVLIYPQEKDAIGVEEMLKIVDESYSLPYEGKAKVFILYSFEKTNILAQNKLLKTLEEPPKNTYFILCTKNEMALLPTIMSRCQKIYLPKYDEKAVREAIKDYDLTEKQRSDVVGFCDGAISKAKEFCEKENFFDIVDFCFKLFLEYKNSSKAILYAKTLYGLKDDFDLFINLYDKILSDVLAVKLNLLDEVKNKQRINDYEEIGKSFSYKAICEIAKYLSEINERIIRNCNQSIIVDNFLMKILEEKAKWQ